MVNGFRYYRALESVSIASALSTALTIYHARSELDSGKACHVQTAVSEITNYFTQ